MRSSTLLATTSAALLACASPAWAGPPAWAQEPADETPRTWYGWQTLVSDGVALGVLALAPGGLLRGRSNSAVLVGGAALFALGPPAIHLLHHRAGAAGLSLLARVAVPPIVTFVGAGIGLLASSARSSSGWDAWTPIGVGALIGFGLGMAGAAAFDAARNSFEGDSPKLSVAPLIGRDGRKGVALAFAF